MNESMGAKSVKKKSKKTRAGQGTNVKLKELPQEVWRHLPWLGQFEWHTLVFYVSSETPIFLSNLLNLFLCLLVMWKPVLLCPVLCIDQSLVIAMFEAQGIALMKHCRFCKLNDQKRTLGVQKDLVSITNTPYIMLVLVGLAWYWMRCMDLRQVKLSQSVYRHSPSCNVDQCCVLHKMRRACADFSSVEHSKEVLNFVEIGNVWCFAYRLHQRQPKTSVV